MQINRKMFTDHPETITAQRIFDHVVISAAEQQRQSGDSLACFYQDGTGAKCFAGMLIPDGLYDKQMELASIGQLIGRYGIGMSFRLDYLKPHEGLVKHLQAAHDHCQSLPDLKQRLREIARCFNLKPALVGTIIRWEVKCLIKE